MKLLLLLVNTAAALAMATASTKAVAIQQRKLSNSLYNRPISTKCKRKIHKNVSPPPSAVDTLAPTVVPPPETSDDDTPTVPAVVPPPTVTEEDDDSTPPISPPSIEPIDSPPALSSLLSRLQSRVLERHNKIRAAHNLDSLQWDASLAKAIQNYADTCPGAVHGGTTPEMGFSKGWQNLANYSPCSDEDECDSNLSAAWMWYNDEENDYDYNAETCPGNKCAHFENMMAPDATGIGCGFATACNDPLVWCNYVNNIGWGAVPPRVNNVSKVQLANLLKSDSN